MGQVDQDEQIEHRWKMQAVGKVQLISFDISQVN